MNWLYFKLCAADNIWGVLAPELLIACSGLLLLSVLWFFPKNQQSRVIRLFSYLTLGLVFGLLLFKSAFAPSLGRTMAFTGMILQTPYTDIFRCFFLLSGLLTVSLASHYFKLRPYLDDRAFYPLLLWVLAGLMTLVQAHHFVLFFVVLELVTVGFYGLIAYQKSQPSLEAALKYLILGALGSPILLMGIALLYGLAGNPNLPAYTIDGMSFSGLHIFIAMNSGNPLVCLGALLILISVAFKVGAVPVQIWVADVYQGAPLPVTGLLAVASKGAGVIVLMNLLHGPFIGLGSFLLPVISVVAIATILFGNCAALAQRFTKRLVGLSGIAHAGYLLLGVIASYSVEWAGQAIIFYLFVYLIASYTLFYVMNLVARENDIFQTVEQFHDLAGKDGFLGLVLAVSLGSLAGVPPLAGFVAKFLLLVAAYQAGAYWGLAAAIVGVIISIYYYFGWMRIATFRPWSTILPSSQADSSTFMISLAGRCLLGMLTAVTLVIGFFPGLLGL